MLYNQKSNSAVCRKQVFSILAVIGLTILFHAGTFFGLDSDFQGHCLRSRLVFLGKTPYLDFFDHKPPLYYFILWPGNLLGGKLFSFFLVHLGYVSILSLLIFHYGKKYCHDGSLASGFTPLLIFLSLTGGRFLQYGNLNGGIIYPVLIFNLIVFFKCFELLSNTGLNAKARSKIACIVGLLSGCSFMTRFSTSQIFITLTVFVLLILFKRAKVMEVLKLGTIYAITFFIPIGVFFVFYHPPFEIVYNQLIVYNTHYSQHAGTLPFWPRLKDMFIAVVDYNLFVFVIGFIALAVLGVKKRGEILSANIRSISTAVVTSPKILLMFLLALVFVYNLIFIYLQNIAGKPYPFFPTFISTSFLASIFISYAASSFSDQRKAFRLFSKIVACVVFILFCFQLYQAKGRILTRAKWPEKKLFGEIKKHINKMDDLFVFSYAPYIYLETGTIPPVGRMVYDSRKWSIYGVSQQKEDELLAQMASHDFMLITTHKNKWHIPFDVETIEKVFWSFEKIGIFPLSYGTTKVDLYRRKSKGMDEGVDFTALSNHFFNNDLIEPGILDGYVNYYEYAADNFPYQMPEAYSLLGYCYFYKGDVSKSLDALDQAIELRSKSFWNYYNKAVFLVNAKRYEEAASVFEKALEADREFTLDIVRRSRFYQPLMAQNKDAYNVAESLDESYMASEKSLRKIKEYLEKKGGDDSQESDIFSADELKALRGKIF